MNSRWSLIIAGLLFLAIGITGCSDDGTDPIEKKITSFVFLLTENPINVNVIATINESAKTITAIMPEGIDINGLIPSIEVSSGATVSPTTAQNFNNPVTYIVTGEDGSTANYTATVTAALSQRDILQIILDENPGNVLSWDLPNTADLGDLAGVTTDFSGNIIELNFFEKGLTKCVPEIGQLTSLIFLSFSLCDISFFPPEIGNLVNLEYLHTPGNRLSSLPEEISGLVKLERLNIGLNRFTSIPIEIAALNNLKELKMGENQISSVPAEIGNLVNLEELELFINQITSLPPELGFLTKLNFLDLRDNQITSLPPELGFLTELNFLFIDDNNLTSIPRSVCLLAAHNDLSISNDVGVDCTANPTELDALISIYAANPNNTLGWGVGNYPEVGISTGGIVGNITANNKNLVRISGGIDALTSLEVLNLNGNSFNGSGALTADIGNISSLTTLTLGGTGINTVPASFGDLSNLTLLSLTDNPITSIPQSVCDLQISNGGILTILTDPGEGCD